MDPSSTPPPSKNICTRIIQFFDIFSYIPVPQAYPVSTNKSKIGSLIFISVMLGYLIYDMYMFVTANLMTINAYEVDVINAGGCPVPNFAFGMYFKNQINASYSESYIINNTAYFRYEFQTYSSTTYPNKTNIIVNHSIPLIPCQGNIINNWTTSRYKQLTCVDVYSPLLKSYNLSYPVVNQDGQLLVSETLVNKVKKNYYLRLVVYVCSNTTSNGTCASADDIANVLKNSTLYFLGLQPGKYDYKQGAALGLDNAIIYKFTVKADATTRSDLYIFPTQIQMYPNFLTKWKLNTTRYGRIQRSTTNNEPNLLDYAYRVRILPEWSMRIVQNHPVTFIDKLSQWSALVGLVLFLGGICFLSYNKNKFARKNPDWENFDKTMKEKVYIELQQIRKKHEETESEKSEMTDKAYENEVEDSDVADKIQENEVEESESVHGGNNITDIRRRILQQNSGGKSN